MSKNKGKRHIILCFIIIISLVLYIKFKTNIKSSTCISILTNNKIAKTKKDTYINKNTKTKKDTYISKNTKRNRDDSKSFVTYISVGSWVNKEYIVTKGDKQLLDSMIGEENNYTSAIINEFNDLGFENKENLNVLAKEYFKEQRGLDKLGNIHLEDNNLCIYFYYHKYNLEVDFEELAEFYICEDYRDDLRGYNKFGVYSTLKRTEDNVYYYDGLIIFRK